MGCQNSFNFTPTSMKLLFTFFLYFFFKESPFSSLRSILKVLKVFGRGKEGANRGAPTSSASALNQSCTLCAMENSNTFSNQEGIGAQFQTSRPGGQSSTTPHRLHHPSPPPPTPPYQPHHPLSGHISPFLLTRFSSGGFNSCF